MEPFAPLLFTQGPPKGADILLRKLTGELTPEKAANEWEACSSTEDTSDDSSRENPVSKARKSTKKRKDFGEEPPEGTVLLHLGLRRQQQDVTVRRSLFIWLLGAMLSLQWRRAEASVHGVCVCRKQAPRRIHSQYDTAYKTWRE